MNSTNDISSTCENESGSSFHDNLSSCANRIKKLSYSSDLESEFDSENETIDVICENSDQKEHSVHTTNSNVYGNVDNICSLSRSFYASKMTVKTKNCFENAQFTINNVTNNTINGRGKNFLIDSILGTNQSSTRNKSTYEDNEEEVGDEHNGNLILFFLYI